MISFINQNNNRKIEELENKLLYIKQDHLRLEKRHVDLLEKFNMLLGYLGVEEWHSPPVHKYRSISKRSQTPR